MSATAMAWFSVAVVLGSLLCFVLTLGRRK